MQKLDPVVILGTAPPTSDGWFASNSIWRLAELCKRPIIIVQNRFRFENVSLCPATRAQIRDLGRVYIFSRKPRYILLGAGVVEAIGWARTRRADGKRVKKCEWYVNREGFTIAIVPHPSRRNRWYNRAANRRKAERFMATLFP